MLQWSTDLTKWKCTARTCEAVDSHSKVTCQRLTDLHSLYLLILPHALKAKTTNLGCKHATSQAIICAKELHMVHMVTAVSVIYIQSARHFFQFLQTFLVPFMLVRHQLAVKHQGENDEQNRSGDHDGR